MLARWPGRENWKGMGRIGWNCEWRERERRTWAVSDETADISILEGSTNDTEGIRTPAGRAQWISITLLYFDSHDVFLFRFCTARERGTESENGCTYSLRGSNPRPMAHKTIALTTELREPLALSFYFFLQLLQIGQVYLTL